MRRQGMQLPGMYLRSLEPCSDDSCYLRKVVHVAIWCITLVSRGIDMVIDIRVLLCLRTVRRLQPVAWEDDASMPWGRGDNKDEGHGSDRVFDG